MKQSSTYIGSCWIDKSSDIQDHQIIKDVLSTLGIPHNYVMHLAMSKKKAKNESRIPIIK